jgi:hypothetical protein
MSPTTAVMIHKAQVGTLTKTVMSPVALTGTIFPTTWLFDRWAVVRVTGWSSTPIGL